MGNGYRLDYWQDCARSVYLGYDGDPEASHGAEDELLAEFVHAIADGLIEDPAAAARVLVDELLSADRIRWYA